MNLIPSFDSTAHKAAFGLATTDETAQRMRMLRLQSAYPCFPTAGLAQEEIQHLSSIPLRHAGPFRLISVGRLLHWKGSDWVRGLCAIPSAIPESEYWIIGDGPERKRLEKLAANWS